MEDIQSVEDLTDYIAKMRKEKHLTLREVAEAIPITPQGLNNWLCRRKSVDWKISSLLALTTVLRFEVTLRDGKIFVKENKRVDIKEDEVEIILDNGKKPNYEIYKDLGEYSIVTLYTPNYFLSNDDETELIQPDAIYNTKEDCLKENKDCTPVKVYGLANNSTKELYDDESCIYVQPERIEEVYLKYLAPAIEKTEDGFDVVKIITPAKYKIVRACAIVDVKDSDVLDYSILDYEPKLVNEKSILGLALIKPDATNMNKVMMWVTNLLAIYEKLWMFEPGDWRYFDRNRNEIVEGSTLAKLGYCDYMDDSSNPEKDDYDDEFPVGTKILVEKNSLAATYKNGFMFKYDNKYHLLYNINFLKWELVK